MTNWKYEEMYNNICIPDFKVYINECCNFDSAFRFFFFLCAHIVCLQVCLFA